jgi:phage tail sheath protein FI
MAGTTPFVGVRVFSDLSSTVAAIDTRDSTVIGLTGPAASADTDKFPLNTRVRFTTDDADMVTALGACLMQDSIAQIASEGIVTTVQVVRTQHSAEADADTKLAAEISSIVGSPSLHAGVWAHANGDPTEGPYPGLLIVPGYTSQTQDGLTTLTLATQGSKLTEAPTVTFTGGGSATGKVLPTATAVLGAGDDADKVVSLVIDTPGRKLSGEVTVSFTGGGDDEDKVLPTATASVGHLANPVMVALDGVCARLIDCMAIGDAPDESVAARQWAADFATSLNIIGCWPSVMVNLGAGNVSRPMSPHVAGATVRRDKEAGNPFKAAWNRPLKGILGPSQPVGYSDGDASSEANTMVQAGLATVIESKLLWAPFTTATDPTTKGWRSIKRIRTRRAIEKAMLRPLRQYLSEDITPHMVTLIFRSLDEYLGDLVALGALIDYEVVWSPSLNPATLLQEGAMRVKARFAETPDLTDLQIYTEPQPEAFDVLQAGIAAAINALGRANLRVAA